MDKNIIKNPKRLITDEKIIEDFEKELVSLKKGEGTSSMGQEIKRNYVVSKTLRLKSKEKDKNKTIAKKFLLEEFYTSDFILTDPLEVTNYFKSKKGYTLKLICEDNLIQIISIDNKRIFTTLFVFKKNLRSFRYKLHLINNDPLVMDSLRATVSSFQVKRSIVAQIKSVLKKWKKVSLNTRTIDIDNILKLDFNNLK